VKIAPSCNITPEMKKMDAWLDNWVEELMKNWNDEVNA
jgi:hypothetical protein|tara:strand:- start:2423 stop:2536 length:114 start_codon:yes stop_codon:yes gene_type:complete